MSSNNKTQCPPLRLTWGAEDDSTFTEKFEVTYSRGKDRENIQKRCYALLMKNLLAIQESPNYSAEQKKEILETIVPAGANHAKIRNLQGNSQVAYFRKLRKCHSDGTAPSHNISQQDPLNFVITYRGYAVEDANHRHLYVIFYTDATNNVKPCLIVADLTSQISIKKNNSHLDTEVKAFPLKAFEGIIDEHRNRIDRNSYSKSLPLAKFYDQEKLAFLEPILNALKDMQERLEVLENK
jgi:hypothetical protein